MSDSSLIGAGFEGKRPGDVDNSPRKKSAFHSDPIENNEIGALSIVNFNILKTEYGNVSHIEIGHTKFGIGSRDPYPDPNPARDALKENPKLQNVFQSNLSQYHPHYFVSVKEVLDNVWPDKGFKFADPENPSLIENQIKNEGRQRSMLWLASTTTEEFPAFRLNSEGKPINPKGLTGVTGRGELGFWGPNPAADPIVFRIHERKLQILLIQRADGAREWAIPGGMLDPGDATLSMAALRELGEETGLMISAKDKRMSLENFHQYTVSLGPVYAGYSDDVRNTDNAWMETNAYIWILKANVPSRTEVLDSSEVQKVRWVDVVDLTRNPRAYPLFASHRDFVHLSVKKFLDYYEKIKHLSR